METSIQMPQNVFLKIFTGKKAKRNIIVLVLFLACFGYIYYKYFGPTTPTTYEYATATRKDLEKTVEGSGKVVSVSELQIQQLQNGGKITSVKVKPGDYVKSGQVIATLDNRQAAIQLEQAKASYQKVINGGNTSADLAIAKQSVINAQQSYNIIQTQQDTAVATAKRTLLNTSIAAVPLYDSRIQPNIPTISGSYTCNAEATYDIKFSTPDYVSVSGGEIPAGQQVRITNVPQALGTCGLFISFDLTKDYSNGEWTVSLPNQISSSYSSNLNSYNNALQARDIALQNASTSVVNAQLAYNQKIQPPLATDVLSANASLQNAELNYDNTIIRAPFDGQIGSVAAAVGQQTNSQAGVATIITKDKIAEISLNEIDVVNVKLGQDVELKFDAIPGETFIGKVAEIDDIGVNTSNVVSFPVKISIPNADERIKSGMSVTANIITDKKANILTVPSATIKTEGSGDNIRSYVLKKDGYAGNFPSRNFASSTNASGTASSTRPFRNRNTTVTATAVDTTNTKVYVTVGLSNNVDTEIIDGLNEGDMVVSKTIAGTAVAKTSSTFSLFGGGAAGGARGGGGGNFGGGTRTTGATGR